ncbi:MAG: UDP-N-acetylmuramate dehydrogenase [Clostridia bacterium]|nr:UDP-N-acetylmuramate dehydrogenase [Clostridia bacterium]
MDCALFEAFAKTLEAEVLTEEPLKNHCSFKIGGPAERLVIPKKESAVIQTVQFARENNVPLTVLGNGSNVLIRDEGLRGIVLKLAGGLCSLAHTGDGTISAGAGLSLKKLCMFAEERSLTGLEFAYGIPGSVGGAVYMNAGAYGGEIKNVLAGVRTVSLTDGSVREYPAGQLSLSYRHTPFMETKEIITAAHFRLTPGDKDAITQQMRTLLAKRKASQPLEYPSAGSTFKRPQVGYAAAMIEQCGLKGLRVGGAEVSRKHAGFVLNTDNASFEDVRKLMEQIQSRVFAETGVMLEPEVEIL